MYCVRCNWPVEPCAEQTLARVEKLPTITDNSRMENHARPASNNVRLRPDATDLAEYISDMLATVEGPHSARDVAESYLDQNMADDEPDFESAVERFIPTVKYYLS
jgi:hypothetical protein